MIEELISMIIKQIYKGIPTVALYVVTLTVILVVKALLICFKKEGDFHIIQLAERKHYIKCADKIEVPLVRDESFVDVIKTTFFLSIELLESIIYSVLYIIVMDIQVEYWNIIDVQKNNSAIVVMVICLVILIPIILSKLNYNKRCNWIIFWLIEYIYFLILLDALGVNKKVICNAISIIPVILLLIIKLILSMYTSINNYTNSPIKILKGIEIVVYIISGIIVWKSLDLYMKFIKICTIISFLIVLMEISMDNSKNVDMYVIKDDGEKLITNKSIVRCTDNRLGLSLKDGTIMFDDNNIKYVTYVLKRSNKYKEKRVAVEFISGEIKEFYSYFWLNKCNICFKEEIENGLYASYVYNINKIEKINKINYL